MVDAGDLPGRSHRKLVEDGVTSHVLDGTAHGAAAVERALRPFQYFNPLKIHQHRIDRAGPIRTERYERDVVQIDSHSWIGGGRADATDRVTTETGFLP